MKKTLLAAALMAGFAGIAQAETSVTLYGIIDGGIGYDRVKSHNADGSTKSTRTGLIDGVQSGNRWGLKGTEDLGNGLRANFVLESGFNLANGHQAQGGRLFGRRATLGLAGDSWGELNLGRQTNIASDFYVDVHGNAWSSTGSGQAFRATDTFRMDNSVVYKTPNFSGFQAGVGYSFNANGTQLWKEQGIKDQNNSMLTTGLRYANGPVAVAASYDRLRSGSRYDLNTGAYSQFKHQSAWNVSGSYDFEVVALSLAFGQDYDGAFGEGYAKKFDYNNYAVALAFPIGEGKLSGSYSLSQPRKEAKDAGEKKQHTFSLAYSHPLSKRTNVYAMGGYVKNMDYVNKDKRTVAGVGIRHQF
ncbi:MAG TPA: porin [Paenalcaligenes hominis]|uniref:Porin n=1 Tax=Paenalcaligenes hominis TaxID=643674 RepID=A0A9D3AB95_9BURK|nr:porin [Paenalcaligenes hominis]